LSRQELAKIEHFLEHRAMSFIDNSNEAEDACSVLEHALSLVQLAAELEEQDVDASSAPQDDQELLRCTKTATAPTGC
jgi:hypothetical protein